MKKTLLSRRLSFNLDKIRYLLHGRVVHCGKVPLKNSVLCAYDGGKAAAEIEPCPRGIPDRPDPR